MKNIIFFLFLFSVSCVFAQFESEPAEGLEIFQLEEFPNQDQEDLFALTGAEVLPCYEEMLSIIFSSKCVVICLDTGVSEIKIDAEKPFSVVVIFNSQVVNEEWIFPLKKKEFLVVNPLSSMPVLLNSKKELINYIRGNLVLTHKVERTYQVINNFEKYLKK